MYDPFAKASQPKTPSGSSLLPPPPMQPAPVLVTAVMNHKAFINGRWYRVGERVNNRLITHIQPNFVGFQEGDRLTLIAVGSSRHVLGTKDVP